MAPSPNLVARQNTYYGDGDGWWYYSETAFIIKWVVTAVIVLALLGFVLGGYFHAQYRIKKGLPPLRYHRWLISRAQRERFFPPTQRVAYHNGPYGHGPAMPLNTYGPPPPAYGENDYVPPYSPPEGASKVNPDQTYQHHGYNQPGSGPSQPAAAAGVYR